MIGRSELKKLKQTTLLTLLKVFKVFGVNKDEHYVYHAIDGTIKFTNGSIIFLMDL